MLAGHNPVPPNSPMRRIAVAVEWTPTVSSPVGVVEHPTGTGDPPHPTATEPAPAHPVQPHLVELPNKTSDDVYVELRGGVLPAPSTAAHNCIGCTAFL